jgi:hypothetical protein
MYASLGFCLAWLGLDGSMAFVQFSYVPTLSCLYGKSNVSYGAIVSQIVLLYMKMHISNFFAVA